MSGRSPFEELGASPGLCETCRHAELLKSRTSIFLRCGLSDRNEQMARFPRLPVVQCRGYEPDLDHPSAE